MPSCMNLPLTMTMVVVMMKIRMFVVVCFTMLKAIDENLVRRVQQAKQNISPCFSPQFFFFSDYMCHHCGKIVAASVVVWAPVSGSRVPPWRAFVEHAESGKTHYIQEIAKGGVNCVSACETCAALSNDQVRYVPPADVVRRADESMRRYRREKERAAAEKALAKAAEKGASPHHSPRRDEIIYVPGDGGLGDSVVMSGLGGAHTTARVGGGGGSGGSLPSEFVFDNVDESDIDYRDISRAEAEQLIESLPPGAAVLRPSSQAGCLSMAYYDIDEGIVKHVLLTHNTHGWITKGVKSHFPSVTALRNHVMLSYKFAEPGVHFKVLSRTAAMQLVVASEREFNYVVRPASGNNSGELCLTAQLTTGEIRHVILQHSPSGWRARGLDDGPYESVRALLGALPREFNITIA